MDVKRIHNFNAGPATLPLDVLQEIQAAFLNFEDTGMSITEISHRSPAFDAIVQDAVARVRRLFNLDDAYHVLFLQGGASLQFCMIPMNFLAQGASADYVNTGTWSTKAIQEARIQGKTIQVVASSESDNFAHIPANIQFTPGATYVHLTSNNTIKGTQWQSFPDTDGVPLVADMSSDIFSRPLDVRQFGMFYAGAQKNMGPAGLCLVVVRDDMLSLIPDNLPTMLNYNTFVAKNSMFNTPPCFAIYTVQLVLKWLEERIGGLEQMAQLNQQKAALLYGLIDESQFYQGTAAQDSRSLMNVTFRLPSEELEAQFVAQAAASGLGGLKGHRSVGGCRASIYNAMPLEGVEALVAFMKDFETEKG